MPTGISTGSRVQATSIRVLWVVLEGTGLDLALNFTTTITSSARTNSVMTVMSTDRKLWNQTMLSITGEAASCSLSLIHISEPTRLGMISYAVFCLKKKK